MLQLFRLLTILVLLAFALNAIVIVIFLAIIAGLIFRTKQTLSLLFLLGALAVFSANPAIGLVVVGLTTIVAFIGKRTAPKDEGATSTNQVKALPFRKMDGIP